MREIRFQLQIVPVTKKNHGTICTIGGRPRMLPSPQYKAFFKTAMQQAPIIRRALMAAGIELPITGPVELSALFYRDRAVGDLTNFLAALQDTIQEPRIRNGKVTRDGMGLILDDSQVYSVDGSRLLKDAAKPRIECVIRFEPQQTKTTQTTDGPSVRRGIPGSVQPGRKSVGEERQVMEARGVAGKPGLDTEPAGERARLQLALDSQESPSATPPTSIGVKADSKKLPLDW